MANLVWKYCTQIAILRRKKPAKGYLRPVFIWADEAANFLTEYDTLWASVSRSAGGAFCLMVQNRESMLRVLKSPSAVDSLLGNLQCQVFCQNSSISTNDYSARLLGERWANIVGISSGSHTPGIGEASSSDSISLNEQKRHYVESWEFTGLKKGGPANGFDVECYLYKAGHVFADGRPFLKLTLNQLA